MSEDMTPEVLPGDLITGPGLYQSKNGDIVQIVGHDCGWWVCECDGKRDWYHSDGTRRFKSTDSDRWKLVRWIGPPPAEEPTTSEQIAEIEEQAADYTPPEGWRKLQPGEVLQPGDAWAHPQADVFETDLNMTGVAGSQGHYLRRQVCEGRWCTRGGEIRNVTRTPDDHGLRDGFPWWDGSFRNTWRDDGRYTHERQSAFDLLGYLGPIESEPEPQPEPQPEPEPQQAPQAETDFEVRIRVLKQCNDNQAETIGRLNGEIRDLRTELAEATQERDAQTARIGHLETITHTHAETIARLHSEIHGLNMEIGGLNRERAQKDDRIGYLETMNSGQATAVKCAGEQNEKLRELADNARRQLEAAADEISELRRCLDAAEKQLDQKDAQIRDLRIELEAAQQVTRPLNDEQREQIWDQATEQAGEQLIRWLRPLTQAMIRQPDDRLCRFMAMTLSIFPDVLPHVLGYAEEEQAENAEK